MSSSVVDVCSSSRDGGGSDNISSGSGGVNSGDWICGDVTCHHSNFARRNKCNKCHRDRSQERSSSVGSSGSNKKKLGTEIGKAAAEKSRGLFSAEDWQCNKCANVNWARRNTCNMCNAPKFCENEERTGFGGGYNDRGIVEYKEREESDSEYDEFGRLKKKRNHSYNQDERPQIVLTKQKTLEEEEDDEEEDGDDDDLAKYNLFSDDEDAIPAKSTNSINTDSPKNSISKSSNKIDKSSMNRRSRSKNRSDVRRRQSRSSSSGGSSSSSSSTSCTSTSSSTSSSPSSSRSSFSDLSISRSRSHSAQKSEFKKERSPSKDTNAKKRKILEPPVVKAEERPTGYSSNSRSKSRSSNHSSRSPSSKRNRSRNSKSSGKLSRSPAQSHRKRSTRSRSLTPKRRR